jgi:hypothetical protein
MTYQLWDGENSAANFGTDVTTIANTHVTSAKPATAARFRNKPTADSAASIK